MKIRSSISALTIVALHAVTPARAAAAQACPDPDLMPAYETFSRQTAALPPQQRADAFVTQVAARYPDYYAAEVFGDDAKLRARALRFFDPALRATVFADALPLTQRRLAELSQVVGAQFAQQQRRFLHTFTDFHCETTVEFGISLLKFDGHPVDFGGRQHLLFGVEVIAMLHGPSDMPAFFDHEIFHLYQRQVVGSRAPQGEHPAWWTMWFEGLATYISQRMNPHLDAQGVLWYPKDMVARLERERPRAAALLLQDIEKTGEHGDRWFLAGAGVEGLPARAGYYLGYLFAKSEASSKSLSQLARLAPEQVHRDAVKFLTRLAASSVAESTR